MTTILLLMEHFIYQFSTLSEKKNEENLSIRGLNFLQNIPSNSVPFSSSLICASVSNATSVEGLSLVKTLALFNLKLFTQRIHLYKMFLE